MDGEKCRECVVGVTKIWLPGKFSQKKNTELPLLRKQMYLIVCARNVIRNLTEGMMNSCNGETCPLRMTESKGCAFHREGGCGYPGVKITEDTLRKVAENNYGEMTFTGEVIR